jgi:4-amino-4-deoxy-L-arabinose transferase-like glycosyltransferase
MKSSFKHLIVLIFFSSILYLIWLDSYGLIDPDEARYAEGAREMIETHNYLIPHLNYEPRINKPPLFYWLIVASFKIFGVNEFSARFPSALAAILVIFLTYFFLKSIKDKKIAFYSSIILLSSLQYLIVARISIIDSCLSLFILLCIYSFWRSYKNNSSPLLFYMFSGIAFILKGPVGLILPFFIILFFSIFSKSFRPLKIFSNLKGWFIFFAISLPWYFILSYKMGVFNFFHFAYYETWGRFGKGLIHKEPFYFYLPVVFLGFFPWIIYFLSFLKKYREFLKDEFIKFCFIWAIAIFIFFSICHTKLATYILPIYTPLAIILGTLFTKYSNEKKLLSSFFIAIFYFLFFNLSLYYFGRNFPNFLYKILPNASLLLIFSFLYLIFCNKSFKFQFNLTFFSIVVFFFLNFFPITCFLSDYRSTKKVVEDLNIKEDIFSYKIFKPSLVFYTKKKINVIDNLKEIKSKNCYLFLRKKDLNKLKELNNYKGEIISSNIRYYLVKLQKLQN